MKNANNHYKYCSPSAMGKNYILMMKKSMTKKSFKETCAAYRCQLMLGRDYGTRVMRSKKDRAKNCRQIYDCQ